VGPDFMEKGDFTFIFFSYAIVWGGVAGIIVSRGARLPATILAAQSIGAGISCVLTIWQRADPADPGLLMLLQHFADRPWIPGAIASYSVLPLLLTTRPLGRAVKALVATGLVLAVLPVALAPLRQREGALPNPWAIPDAGVQDALRTIIVVDFTLTVVLAVVTLAV